MEVTGKISDSVGSKRCVPCNIEGNVKAPAGLCRECEEFMCQECFIHHLKSKICRSHVLYAVSQEQPEEQEEESITEVCEYCSKHTNQAVRYYCRQHASVSCGDCLVSEHHGCRIEFVKDLAKDFKESTEFKVMMEQIKKVEFEKEECLEQNKRKMEENATLREKALREIKEFLQELKEILELDRNEIENNVSRLSKKNETFLSEIKEEINRVDKKSTEIKRTLDLSMHSDIVLFIRHVEFRPAINELKTSVADIKKKSQIMSYAFQPENWLKDLFGTRLTLGTVSGQEQTKNDKAEHETFSSKETRENNVVLPMTGKTERHALLQGLVADKLIHSSDEIKDENETRSMTKIVEHPNKETRSDDSIVKKSEDQIRSTDGLSRRGVIVSIDQSVLDYPTKPTFRTSFFLKSKDVKICRKIGEGEISQVYIGEYKKKPVAVKVIKEKISDDQRKRLLVEGSILYPYKHQNIENFIGIVAQQKTVMLVMEYMPGGSLLQYLHTHGKEQSNFRATHMCLDIASGMEYLAENGCIHTDLRANNCLIEDKHTSSVKISVLGMITNKEVNLQEIFKFPVKWSAPEIWYGKVTTTSDVWSFGVLMWEIFSKGQTPYPGWNNRTTTDNVDKGYRLFAPPKTPDSIYQLMLKCWDIDPLRRITFESLRKQLTAIVTNPPEDDDWE